MRIVEELGKWRFHSFVLGKDGITMDHQCVTLKGWALCRSAWEEKQLNSPQMDRHSLSLIFCSFSLDEGFVKAISPSSARVGQSGNACQIKVGRLDSH